MPRFAKRTVPPLLIFFAVLASAMPAVAQFVSPPPAPPILSPNVARPPSQVGEQCATRAGTCRLNAPAPLGYQCTCSTSRGPVYGQTVR
jgi:hypothetical protein